MDTVAIEKKVEELREVIADYESDTFSASGAEMSADELDAVVETMALRALQSMIDLDTMDGDELRTLLEEIREDA